MSKFCPNKNTPEFKQMAAVLGDNVATACWYENQGHPIWETNTGDPSPLWNELVKMRGVTDAASAMLLKHYMYTKSFKAAREGYQLNIFGEPSLEDLLGFVDRKRGVAESKALYKRFNLVDKVDPNKPIKWSVTDVNYRKILKIVQNINQGSVASARIIKLASNGREYYTITLTPKTAFTNTAGEKTAYYDASTGEITFTAKGLTAETVIHEFAHPFVDALETHNKDLFDNLINTINKDSNVPEIKAIIDHVNTNYSDASEEIRNKEMLAYVLSEYGKGNIDPETGKNTRDAIKRFYKWLTTLVKDLMDQMRSRKTLYVDQIHPNTKYNEIADLFTVYSEIGDISLGASPSGISKKIAPEEITDPKDAKRAALKAKMAKRQKDNTGGSTEATKLINVSTAQFVDIKDEAAHMSTLLPKKIATELTPDYIKVLSGGRAVVGMFKDGVIHLTEKGPRGTAYHEGFHAVFRTIQSGSEQNRIISEAETMFAAPTAKDIFDLELQLNVTSDEAFKIYYEEQLADAFAEYMEDPTRETYPEGIRGFFKRIADWISRVFFNKGHVDHLFSNISTGKYTKATPNISRSVAYKVHPIFDIHEVNKITRELISVAFKDISTIEDLRVKSIHLAEVENHIVDLAIEAEESGNEELMDNLSSLFDPESGDLDNFWLAEMDSYLRNVIGLTPKNSKKEIKETLEDLDEENAEDLERNNFLKASYEVSGKTNATAAIKFMVAMTPQVRIIDSNKPTDLDNIELVASTLTGLPVLVDYAIMYNDLENVLAGITSINVDNQTQDALELMLSTMKAQAKYKPEMLFLADKIDNASEEIRTQFFGAFSKQKGSFVHHQVIGSMKNRNISSLLSTSNFSTKANVLFNSWTTNFAHELGHTVNKERVYNPEKIAEFLSARDAFMPVLEEAMIAAEDSNIMIPQHIISQFENLLKKLGISISPHTINYLVESSIKEGYDLPYAAEYAQRLNNLFYDFVRATNDLKTRTGAMYGKYNHIQDNSRFFKSILAEADSYFKQVPGENSFVGPEGNQIYSFQHNDLTSKAVQRFKQGDLSYLQAIATSAYGKNSVWAAELLHPVNGKVNRDGFELHMYGNLRSEETAGDRGAKASELKTSETYMDIVNKTLDGFFIGLAEADKARQTYVKGPKFRRIGFQITRNAEEDTVSYKILNKNGLAILKGYLADELSRMRTAADVVYGTVKSDPVPEKDWILYYHYYPVAPGKGTIGENLDKIPGNAFNSYLFPTIDLVKYGLQTTEGEVLVPNAANFDNNAALDKYIITHFGNLVRAEMNYALEQGLLEKDKAGNVVNALVSADHVAKYTREGVIYMEELMGDYVLNSIIGNIEFTKLFNGDPAIYKIKGVGKQAWAELDHFGDFKKRVPAIFASGQDFRIFKAKDGTPIVRPHYISTTINNISTPSAFFGERLENGEIGFNDENLKVLSSQINVSVEKLKEVFKPYLEINQTDAQAWITLDAYKERLNGLGKWTPEHQDAYDKANAGEDLNPVEIKLLAQPLKTVHAELVQTNNKEMIMNYNKQSEAVLLPFMRNLEIGKLLTAMERDGIDHVIVLDGKKAGAQGIVDVTDTNGNILEAKDIKMNPVALSYNNLFLQQDLPSKGVKDTLVGSQGTKNVLSVVNLTAEYFHGKTGRELINIFHETIGRLSDSGLVSLDKSLGYKAEGDTYSLDEQGRSKIHKIVQREFEGEISENHYDALDENISFDALPIKNKIMNKLLALTTKKTVKLKQSGGAMIQLSDFGFVGTTTKLSDKVKDGIIWFKNPTERLKPMHATEEGIKPAQILMPQGKIMSMLATNKKFKATILEKYGTENYKELTHNQLQSIISKDVLEGLSYRIPNQGPSSNDAFEIVGILPPEMGDTMIAFSDITTKTGSDFDIDKAFIVLPNFYYDEHAGKIKKATYDINDLSKLRPKELQNLRLDLMRQMLLHPDAYTAVMAPLDDPWLENFAKSLFPEKTKLRAMEFFTGRYQSEIKSTFDGAKALVGSIANHMTHHSLALADELYFKDYYLGLGMKTSEGETSLSNVLDQDGKPIATTLGGYMNAIVDAAKDPFIARANVNLYTANTVFMLVRAGVSREWIVAFTGQPIIRDIVAAQDQLEGRFAKPIWKDGKRLSAIESVLEKYGYENENISEIEFRSSDKFPTLQDPKSGEIKVTTQMLIDAINSTNAEGENFKNNQLKILKQFLEWQKKGSELNDLIKVSKADVEGATKTLMTAQLAVNLANKVLDVSAIGNADKMLGIYRSETGDFDIPAEGSQTRMIGRYFDNSVLAAIKRFRRFFISGSEASQKAVETIAKHSGYTELTTGSNIEKVATDISNEVYTLAASDTRIFNIEPERLHALLYGVGAMKYGADAELSIAARVEAAKHTELASNLLINGLQFQAGRDGAPDKVYLPNTETVKDTKEALAQAWSEILQVNKELGEDLILYAFYTTGFSTGVGSFAEHIPNEWLKAHGFHEDIAKKNIEYGDMTAINAEQMDKIYKNLYKNNQLVPVVDDKSLKAMQWSVGGNLVVDKDHGFLLTQDDSLNYTLGTGPHGKIFKRFVKRSEVIFDQDGKAISKKFKLYKLAGYTNNNDAVYLRTNTLGISGYGNNVKEYIGDGNVSVFNQNNVSLPEGLMEIAEMLNKRGAASDTAYDDIHVPVMSSESVEERLQFCIMK